MPETQSARDLQRMAGDIFELMKLAFTARTRARADRPEQLSEAEFLALDALSQDATLSVGDIQKQIGVLPAQMSRIVRSLEKKSGGKFVECSINSDDRRKVDVRITPNGQLAHKAYETVRLEFAKVVLLSLPVEDREQFMEFLAAIRSSIANQLNNK